MISFLSWWNQHRQYVNLDSCCVRTPKSQEWRDCNCTGIVRWSWFQRNDALHRRLSGCRRISHSSHFVFFFDGFIGLIILFTATAIGLITSFFKVGKNHLMGCLILPVILFFIL